MKKEEIKRRVDLEIVKWLDLQKGKGYSIDISSGAFDFICLMIENIVADQSKYWSDIKAEDSSLQQEAIKIVPMALTEVLLFPNGRIRRVTQANTMYISSWEIWHTLSRIIEMFCFIPKGI